MTKCDVFLQVFHNRGWLSLALVSALLEDPAFARPAGLLGLEQAGLLLRRRLPGGLVLFRVRPQDANQTDTRHYYRRGR